MFFVREELQNRVGGILGVVLALMLVHVTTAILVDHNFYVEYTRWRCSCLEDFAAKLEGQFWEAGEGGVGFGFRISHSGD